MVYGSCNLNSNVNYLTINFTEQVLTPPLPSPLQILLNKPPTSLVPCWDSLPPLHVRVNETEENELP